MLPGWRLPVDTTSGQEHRKPNVESLSISDSPNGWEPRPTRSAGQDVASSILDYARNRNVTKILIGKTHQPRWKRLFFGSVVDNILENSGDIDVYVIHGEKEVGGKRRKKRILFSDDQGKPYLWLGMHDCRRRSCGSRIEDHAFGRSPANTVMLFLAAVAYVAVRFGRGPAILASVLAVLAFDFFFVPPYLTFAVSDAQYVVTFGVMLVIGLIISTLDFTPEASGRKHSIARTPHVGPLPVGQAVEFVVWRRVLGLGGGKEGGRNVRRRSGRLFAAVLGVSATGFRLRIRQSPNIP